MSGRNRRKLADHLVAEWHPTRNAGRDPNETAACSNKKVWWKCADGHEWEATPNSRSRGRGCPYCSGRMATSERNLATVFPALVEEWHPTLNGGLAPSQTSPFSHRKIWWLCPKGHSYEATPDNRAHKNNCPYCSGRRVCQDNSLARLRPDLAKEWHPTMNGTLTASDVTVGAGLKCWWVCKHGHEWSATPNRRSQGRGCPYCAGKRPSSDHNLAAVAPELSRQWHHAKNGNLTPDMVVPRSCMRVWWICGKGHEWIACPEKRASGQGCPYCNSRLVGKDNNLSILRPDIACEWHPTRNGDLKPDGVLPKSNRRVWWLCDQDHEWRAMVANRTGPNGTGCPHCSKRISRNGSRWLDSRDVAVRELLVHVGKRRFFVDGFDRSTNTVYEFLGDYWHGNPSKYVATAINRSTGTTFGSLLRRTLAKFELLHKAGFTIVYRWESSDADEVFAPPARG